MWDFEFDDKSNGIFECGTNTCVKNSLPWQGWVRGLVTFIYWYIYFLCTSSSLLCYLFIVIFIGNTNVRVHDNVSGSVCTCGGIQILVFLFWSAWRVFWNASRRESANRYCFQGQSETDTKVTRFYFYKRRKGNYQFGGEKKWVKCEDLYDSIFLTYILSFEEQVYWKGKILRTWDSLWVCLLSLFCICCRINVLNRTAVKMSQFPDLPSHSIGIS